jgi:mevalonate pyrophosphate decarboxylase
MIAHIKSLRANGFEIFATMDAGPNVKILTRNPYKANITSYFKNLNVEILWSEIDHKGAYILDETVES